MVAAYLLVLVVIGWVTSGRMRDEDSFFLGNRTIPTWAVALSILATTLSAATFIGVPELAYRSDLTYLVMNLGGIVAAFIVAAFFFPPLYRAGTLTVYGFLGKRFGYPAEIAASVMFLVGRLLASGARLFIAAIAFSLVLYGTTEGRHLMAAILIFGSVGLIYTIFGGIRAVIWTDAIQIMIVASVAVISIALLLNAIPLSTGEIVEALRFHGEGKLRVLDFGVTLGSPFTIWSGIIAATFVSTAAYSVDQDMVQRMLATRRARSGGISLVAATLLGVPVVFAFLCIGLLLSIYYGRPDLMGAMAPVDTIEDSKGVFPQFLLHHLPAGAKGLAIVGVLAAAMSSLDSAINAMASSVMSDLYFPLKERWSSKCGRGATPVTNSIRNPPPTTGKADPVAESRLAVLAMGLALIGFALLAVWLQSAGNQRLIDYALGIMAFANAPLLGVFCGALFTRRGNSATALAGMASGVLVVLALQPGILRQWSEDLQIAWPWWWVMAAPVSFLICISVPGGKARKTN